MIIFGNHTPVEVLDETQQWWIGLQEAAYSLLPGAHFSSLHYSILCMHCATMYMCSGHGELDTLSFGGGSAKRNERVGFDARVHWFNYKFGYCKHDDPSINKHNTGPGLIGRVVRTTVQYCILRTRTAVVDSSQKFPRIFH